MNVEILISHFSEKIKLSSIHCSIGTLLFRRPTDTIFYRHCNPGTVRGCPNAEGFNATD